MSINALANAAAARRPDFFPRGKAPAGLREIAEAARTPAMAEPQAPDRAEPRSSSAQIDTALHVLFGYIPTEVLTLYVAEPFGTAA
jgi:hypothetical protein